MPAAITLRSDYDAPTLRRLARTTSNSAQSRRLLAIAAICDGMSRADAARIGGMDRQTLRDWVLRFNAEGPDGLVDRKSTGAPRRLNDAQMSELAALVDRGPDPDQDGVVRWRCVDLIGVIEQRFGVSYAERGVANLLKVLGFSHMSSRPQHPKQDAGVIEMFKKTSQTRWQRI